MGMHCTQGFGCLYFGCYYLSSKMPSTRSWFSFLRVAVLIANIAVRHTEKILYLLLLFLHFM